jgi:thiol:disulfide interchange protein DsbD
MFSPAVGMFGFALAVALPFTLFAIFPSLLKQTPRSGGWMNTIKVVLGVVEIAFALKFLSVADLTKGWGILDRETFLVLWIALFILLGMYLLKVIRMPHDDPEDKTTSVTGFFGALLSFAFAMYMIPGLWGAPCKAISAFAPPMSTQDFNIYEIAADGENATMFTPDTYDYDEAIKMSREQNKPIFLDFTGHGCVNCREMEAVVLNDKSVLEMLSKDFIVVSLYVDDRRELDEPFTDKNGLVYTEIGEKWSYLQESKFGALSQPYYVLVNSDGQPLNGAYAFDKKVDNFKGFLNEGLRNFKSDSEDESVAPAE